MTARRRYVLSAMLRPMVTYVARVRSNLARLQNRLNSISSAASNVGGGGAQGAPAGAAAAGGASAPGAVDPGVIENIRRRVEEIQKRISDIVSRISSSLSPFPAASAVANPPHPIPGRK